MNSLVIGLGAMAYGKERRAVRTFKQLHKVCPYFLTSKWEDGSVSHLLRENNLDFGIAPFGYLGRAKPVWTLVAILHMPLLWTKVVASYLKRRCNLIVVISASAFLNALPAILALKYVFRARLVFYLGDSAKPYWVNQLLAKLITWTAQQVITNSESVARSWVKVGVAEEITKVIYNGVDISRFEAAKPYDFRNRFGWPSETVLIGYAGQFRPNKGVLDFVAAAEIVRQTNANCRFILIGKSSIDDAHEREVQTYIKDRGLIDTVVFAGWTENIEEFFAGLDIICVPSRHEDPAPNINIEAMASGLPVVATNVGGTPELIIHGETGLLCEKGRPDLIADNMIKLACDLDLRRRMGEAGSARVNRLFDIKKNALQIEEVLIEA